MEPGIKLIEIEYCECQNKRIEHYVVDTDADFSNLPTGTAGTGSTATCLASKKVKVVNTEGNWVFFGG